MTEKLDIPLGGGINLHNDPVAIGDGQWQRLKNLAQVKEGIIGQRPSLTFVREINPVLRFSGALVPWDARIAFYVPLYFQWARTFRPIKFIFDPNFGEITAVVVTTESTRIFTRPTNNETWTRGWKTVPAGTMLVVSLPNFVNSEDATELTVIAGDLGQRQQAPSIITFLGNTYVFAGGSRGFKLGKAETSVEGPEFIGFDPCDFGTANTGFFPDGAAVVRNRVVYYVGSRLVWSDKNNPLVVGSTVDGVNFPAIGTRDLYLGGDENEPITAVAEISTTAQGSPTQSVTMAFTRTSAFMMYGEPLETNGSGNLFDNLQINKLNIECGCIAQSTICRTPYGTFWVGKDDVWFMPFGSLPMRVGTALRPLLENLPVGVEWKMHAEYYDGKYRVSFPTPGQDIDIASPLGSQYWLDLSAGPPQGPDARWFGPQQFVQGDAPAVAGGPNGDPGVWCMAKDLRKGGDGKLYALQSFCMVGGADVSSIYGLSLCGFDAYDGRDTCAPQMEPQPWFPSIAYEVNALVVPAPAQSGAQGMNAPAYICSTAGTSDSSEPDWFAPDADGNITDGTVVWTAIKFDKDEGAVISAYAPKIDQGSNYIEWSMLSKELVMGDPQQEKLLDGAELGYWVQSPTYLTYNSHPDQDIRHRILGVTPDTATPNELGLWTGARVWQRKLLTPSPTKRFNALSATWECKQEAGLVIVAGVNDTVSFTVDGDPFEATVAAGYYEDLTTLDTAMLNAMNALGAWTISSTIFDSVNVACYGIKEATTLPFSIDCAPGGLLELFGFNRDQGTLTDPGTSTYLFGISSPSRKVAPPMQLSSLKLRYRIFNRGPT